MTREFIEKCYEAWTITGEINESYANIENILLWLQDQDIWTEPDKAVLEGFTQDDFKALAEEIADMVRENILIFQEAKSTIF